MESAHTQAIVLIRSEQHFLPCGPANAHNFMC